MLEMKSVAKSIKYCALEYCAEKSTARLVQFSFWPIKAREFYVSNFCTVQNLTDLFFSFDQDSIIGLSCHSASDDSPVEDDEHDGDHVAADLLHHQVDLVTLPLLLLTTGAATLLEDWSKLSHLNSWTVSRHRMDAHLFDLLLFHQFCELVCRDPPKYLIHSMRVILIGWLNEAVSFWRRKKRQRNI